MLWYVSIMDRLQSAAVNDADWCAAVWRTHGLIPERANGTWFTQKDAPSLYPNIVTVEPAHEGAEQIAMAVAAAKTLTKAAVKDSYSALPLADHGYAELFKGQWLWAEPATLATNGRQINCEKITNEAAVLEWIVTWEHNGGEANNLLPALLSDDRVEFWANYGDDGEIRGGLIAFRSSEVTGITNLFGSTSGLVRAVAIDRGSSVCCYEHGAALAWAMRQGFEAIGPLTVWICNQR
jgi:hypothetical protein